MILSAIRAISRLWVIMTMVWRNSRLVIFRSPITSSLVLESGFPVGSSGYQIACVSGQDPQQPVFIGSDRKALIAPQGS